MTVSYSSKIATVHYGSFARLLLLWNGSVYKVVWPGLLIFCVIYSTIALVYQAIPSNTFEYLQMKRRFVQLCVYAGRISNAIPISFVLGFYVNLIVGRWWKQFLHLPTPDSLGMVLTAYLNEPKSLILPKPQTKRSTIFRRQIIRYMNLSSVLCFSSISVSMKRRFPSLESLVEAGLMTDKEMTMYSKHDESLNHFFVPIVWAIHLVRRAYREKMIGTPRHMDGIIREISSFWNRLYTLFLYDCVNIPLVYNQVVALAVYLYFAVCVLSQQFADPASMLKASESSFKYLLSKHSLKTSSFGINSTNFSNPLLNATVEDHEHIVRSTLDVLPNIPVFTVLALLFYDGWVKVAEEHVFPFGDDDDDFDVIPLLERNIKASVWMVDTALGDHDQLPELVRTGCQPKSASDHDVDGGGFLTDHISNTDLYSSSRFNNDNLDSLSIATSYRRDSITEIPDLPCPESLRRNVSKNFFRGSLAMLYDDMDETIHNRRARNSVAYESGSCTASSDHSSTGPGVSGRVSWLGSANAMLSRIFHRASIFSSNQLTPSTPRLTVPATVHSNPDYVDQPTHKNHTLQMDEDKP